MRSLGLHASQDDLQEMMTEADEDGGERTEETEEDVLGGDIQVRESNSLQERKTNRESLIFIQKREFLESSSKRLNMQIYEVLNPTLQ